MTPLVRRFIKTAILFLVLGLSLGLFMLIRRELFNDWPPAYVISAHTHAVFVGFVMFMILGRCGCFPNLSNMIDAIDRYLLRRCTGCYLPVRWLDSVANWRVVTATCPC